MKNRTHGLYEKEMELVKRLMAEYEVAGPRDRNGEFEPKIIEKRQTLTDKIDQKNMAMYANSIYTIIFFDGIVFNSRKDNRIVSKCIYSVFDINMEGQKGT